MKRKILRLAAGLLLLCLLPAALLISAFGTPVQFGESYYGELPVLYEKLKNTEEKKIVLIGNSALAFGARTDLMEEELDGWSVVLFGLYGAVGTRAMLELGREEIGTGDIVIIAPELNAQTCSLYFSPQDLWRAADGDRTMLKALSAEEKTQMVYAFPNYASEKYQSRSGKSAFDSALPYARAAFENEAGENVAYMTFERPYNVMAGGYDAANLPLFGPEAFGEGFIDYLNEYAASLSEKGASVCFGFTPLNELSLGGETAERADALYDWLRAELDFPVLGHPAKYVMDYRLFYDNNFHLNSAGAVYYTDNLTEDLKLLLGIRKASGIELPQIPAMPERGTASDEAGDADCFLYEKRSGALGDYAVLTGLTEKGKAQTSLTLPAVLDGLPVRQFEKEVFAGNGIIARIVLPSSITTIYDGSFEGALRLRELIFRHDEVLSLSLGPDFLKGADDCLIYVKQGVSTVDCAGGWARYASRLRRY